MELGCLTQVICLRCGSTRLSFLSTEPTSSLMFRIRSGFKQMVHSFVETKIKCSPFWSRVCPFQNQILVGILFGLAYFISDPLAKHQFWGWLGCCAVGIRWRCNSVLGHPMTCTPGRCYAMLNSVEYVMVDACRCYRTDGVGYGAGGVGMY